MQKKSVSIHAILKTLSPLHIASPESFRYVIDNDSGYGRVVSGGGGPKSEGIACAGIQRRRFAASAVDGIDFGVPLIAANNIAGRMRRQASRLTLDVLRAKKQQVKLSTYAAITCGAINGMPDSRDLTYAEYKEASLHPLVGLFGGGPRLLPRRMQVLDALPVMEGLRAGGYSVAHPNNVGKVSALTGLTFGAAFRRCDDVSALLDVDRMVASVEDFAAQHHARQLLIFEDQKKKDSDEKGSRHSTKAWSAYEAVAPAVDFDFTINLKNVTDAQIGLFLLALDGFAKEPIGGQSRNGLGRIALNDVVLTEFIEQSVYVSDNIFNNNALVQTLPAAKQYLDAWANAQTDISADRLDEIMKPPVVETEDDKAAKALAKAAKKLGKAPTAA